MRVDLLAQEVNRAGLERMYIASVSGKSDSKPKYTLLEEERGYECIQLAEVECDYDGDGIPDCEEGEENETEKKPPRRLNFNERLALSIVTFGLTFFCVFYSAKEASRELSDREYRGPY